MEEQLISFEVAKLAKEKGFNVGCYAYYETRNNILYRENDTELQFTPCGWGEDDGIYDFRDICYSNDITQDPNLKQIKQEFYSAPTQSLLQKWLREKKEIYVHVEVWRNMDHCDEFTAIITKPAYIKPLYNKTNKGLDIMESKEVAFKHSYEEAFEAGLKEALQLIDKA